MAGLCKLLTNFSQTFHGEPEMPKIYFCMCCRSAGCAAKCASFVVPLGLGDYDQDFISALVTYELEMES